MSLRNLWAKIKPAVIAFFSGVGAVLGVLLWVLVKRKPVVEADVKPPDLDEVERKSREKVLAADPATLVAGLSDDARARIDAAGESAADRIVGDYLKDHTP